MGAPKPLLPWRGATLIEYQVGQLRGGGADEVIVVLGHGAADVRAFVVGRAQIVVNNRWTEGRAVSLRAGAALVPDDASTIVVLNVDQPRPAEVIRRLLDEHASGGAPVTLPAHGGKRGHPAFLDGSLLTEMRSVTDETEGLRAVVQRHDVREVAFDDEVVLLDLNTPEDYERAYAMYGKE